MERWEYVEELLDAVGSSIGEFEAEYERARGDDAVIHVFRHKVKTSMEHLRSCLDYMACEIHERKLGPLRRHTPYFPYGDTPARFTESAQKHLPRLSKLAPEVYSVVEGVQPHKCGADWLPELCTRTNRLKHDTLEQTRIESAQAMTTVQVAGVNLLRSGPGSRVTFKDCTVNGVPVGVGTPMVIDTTQPTAKIRSAVQPNALVTRRDEGVQFRLKGSNKDLLASLKEATAGVRKLATELRPTLEKNRASP